MTFGVKGVSSCGPQARLWGQVSGKDGVWLLRSWSKSDSFVVLSMNKKGRIWSRHCLVTGRNASLAKAPGESMFQLHKDSEEKAPSGDLPWSIGSGAQGKSLLCLELQFPHLEHKAIITETSESDCVNYRRLCI